MTNGNRNKEDRVILLHLSLPSIECYVCLRGRQFGICEDVRTLVKEKRVGAGMAERHVIDAFFCVPRMEDYPSP